ncbi:YqzH family protein [Ectobacillus funiculus]|uniref:YqzH family protein n=1 Tax=Ectobacillus funiculus TaxID=137993 RepID=UPI00397DDCBB
MNEALIKNMIRNCFYQYHYTKETLPLSESDYRRLLEEIWKMQRDQPDAELYELIEDVVYEFITNSNQ